MKLTGWDIEIFSETEYNKMRKGEAEAQMEELQGQKEDDENNEK